jgi:hypothetical protein
VFLFYFQTPLPNSPRALPRQRCEATSNGCVLLSGHRYFGRVARGALSGIRWGLKCWLVGLCVEDGCRERAVRGFRFSLHPRLVVQRVVPFPSACPAC